jgi:hypothetical protein
MPWYGYIHPLFALAALALGLVTGQTSLSKLTHWDFPLRTQRYRSVFFFLMTVVNFVLGLIVATELRGHGFRTRLTGHTPLAVVTMVLAMLAAIVTFTRGRSGEVSGMMRLHPLLVVAALALIFTSGMLVFWALVF